jgi:hypothetical protein
MLRKHLLRQTFRFGACGVALLFYATPGQSQDRSKAKGKETPATCSDAYKSALQMEESGRLQEARDTLLTCAKSACGNPLRQQCMDRYSRLDSDIPSVIPLVTDDVGDPKVDVQVTMDGKVLTSKLDGRSLPVDPGLHEFSFSGDTGIFASQTIMIVQGHRNRRLSAVLPPRKKRGGNGAPGPASMAWIDAKASLEKPMLDRPSLERPASDATSEKPISEKAESHKTSPEPVASERSRTENRGPKSGPGTLPYIIGAAGVAGLGGYGLLTLWGRQDNNALAQCAPTCSGESVAHIKSLYLAADVSLGIGVAALGTSLIWLIASPSSKEEPVTQATYRFDVKPTAQGGFATVSGSF